MKQEQTAVELIKIFMEQNHYFIGNDLLQYFEQAKEMEKRQIEYTDLNSYIIGSQVQAKLMYSDMQDYAEFCIECDRKQMPLLLVEDWYQHYKK